MKCLVPASRIHSFAYSDDLAPLSDLFSNDLGLPVPVETALTALGELHARLSGRAYNWRGSYREHVPLFLRQLRRAFHAVTG